MLASFKGSQISIPSHGFGLRLGTTTRYAFEASSLKRRGARDSDNLVNLVLIVYMWIIIARALISWVSPDPYNPIVRFLYRVTEPVLRPIRHRLPMMAMGLDLSPMVVLLGLYFLQSFLVPVLYRIAAEIG